jgi:hypothetical protein
MPYRNDEEFTLRTARWAEVCNVVASTLMVLILLGACILLDRQNRQVVALRDQLEVRNGQGARGLELAEQRNEQGIRSLELLEAAVKRLDLVARQQMEPIPEPEPDMR